MGRISQLIRHIRYFWYHATNWSMRLAWFVAKHELRGEAKYQLDTIGIDNLRNSMPAKMLEHASIYQPVNYYTAETLFNRLTAEDKKHGFLDMGCGKGRVLAVAAFYGFKNITGVDFSAQLCHDAVDLASKLEQRYTGCKIFIDCEDAAGYALADDIRIIFLFNPFDAAVMGDFILRIAESVHRNPRPVKILYAAPVCKKLFLQAGFKESFVFKKMRYLEGCVLELG